jgi:hypothetical protein
LDLRFFQIVEYLHVHNEIFYYWFWSINTKCSYDITQKWFCTIFLVILCMKQSFIVWNFPPVLSYQHSKISNFGAFWTLDFQIRDAPPIHIFMPFCPQSLSYCACQCLSLGYELSI